MAKKTKLHRFMRAAEIGDRALAEEIGVDWTTVFRVRTGRVIASGATAYKIATWARELARKKRLPKLTIEDVLGI